MPVYKGGWCQSYATVQEDITMIGPNPNVPSMPFSVIMQTAYCIVPTVSLTALLSKFPASPYPVIVTMKTADYKVPTVSLTFFGSLFPAFPHPVQCPNAFGPPEELQRRNTHTHNC